MGHPPSTSRARELAAQPEPPSKLWMSPFTLCPPTLVISPPLPHLFCRPSPTGACVHCWSPYVQLSCPLPHPALSSSQATHMELLSSPSSAGPALAQELRADSLLLGRGDASQFWGVGFGSSMQGPRKWINGTSTGVVMERGCSPPHPTLHSVSILPLSLACAYFALARSTIR